MWAWCLDEAYFPEVLNADQVGRVMTRTYQRWDAKVYAAYLRRFDLPLKKAFKDFSRGMRMKLSIAAALSHDSRLLLLDEATSGLDPVVRDEMLDVLRDFIQDERRSVLLSSHIISDLEKVCDYVTFLHKGRLLLSEPKDELMDRYVMAKAPEAELRRLDPAAVVGIPRRPLWGRGAHPAQRPACRYGASAGHTGGHHALSHQGGTLR